MNDAPLKRSRWIGHAKGLLRIVKTWEVHARCYPNDRKWQQQCQAEIAELKRVARMYLNWMKNERAI